MTTTDQHLLSIDLPTATYTIEEAAQVLGVGRSAAYAAARSGDLPTIRIGRRLLVPRIQLELLLSGSESTRH